MKKDYLRIYSAYLPYELKVKSYLTDTEFIVKGISFRGSLQNEEGYDMTNIERAKPIIYSMDMLTKEIEHKGEKFIPIENLTFKSTQESYGGLQEYNDQLYKYTKYEDIQKLLEWHFNVFGLGESEYIQKQSVIQK